MAMQVGVNIGSSNNSLLDNTTPLRKLILPYHLEVLVAFVPLLFESTQGINP